MTYGTIGGRVKFMHFIKGSTYTGGPQILIRRTRAVQTAEQGRRGVYEQSCAIRRLALRCPHSNSAHSYI